MANCKIVHDFADFLIPSSATLANAFLNSKSSSLNNFYFQNGYQWNYSSMSEIEESPCTDYGEITADYTIGSVQCDETAVTATSLPNANITNKKIRINGRLSVDRNLSLTECIIEMGPDAEIHVLPGKVLSIGRSVIYSCDTLWRSIRVSTGGRLNLWGEPIRNNIHNAKAAVFAHTGAILVLNGTNFIDNMIGFYIPPGIQINPDWQTLNTITLLQYSQLDYTGSGTLLPPSQTVCSYSEDSWESQNYFTISPQSKSYAGVLMYDVTAISLTPPNPVVFVNYHTIHYGIVAFNSNFNVNNSQFANIPQNENYLIKGYGIYGEGNGEILNQEGYGKESDVNFDNVKYSIYVKNMNLFTEENNMVDVVNGIEAFQCKQRTIDIGNNNI